MPTSTTFQRTFLTRNITNLCTRLTGLLNGSVASVTLPHTKQLFCIIQRHYFCSWQHATRLPTLRLCLSRSFYPSLPLSEFLWPIQSLHFDTSSAEFDNPDPSCWIRLHFLIHFLRTARANVLSLAFHLIIDGAVADIARSYLYTLLGRQWHGRSRKHFSYFALAWRDWSWLWTSREVDEMWIPKLVLPTSSTSMLENGMVEWRTQNKPGKSWRPKVRKQLLIFQ